MCGRLIQCCSAAEYAASLGLPYQEDHLPTLSVHFNGAPGQDFLVIRRHPEGNEPAFTALQWGFVPSSADDPKIALRLINARTETVVTAAAFRAAYRYRRCLIPVDGFYEWKKLGPAGKQPHAIGMASGRPFTIAGLWENWKKPSGGWLRTFTILTTRSNKLLADLNDRMPLIIEQSDRDRWLGEEEHPGDLLRPPPSEGMTRWLVSPQVNSLKHNSRSLLEPMATAAE